MSSSSQSVNGHNEAHSTPNPELIREQLNRLVAHPLFTNSRRYPVMLAYAVEQTLLGNAGELKERTIGVEAFGREPNYDVNLDPVVRTAAAEVRKRLSQYYYNPEHAGELVIELPVGTYVPNFREPAGTQTHPEEEALSTERVEPSAQDGTAPLHQQTAGGPAHTNIDWRRWIPSVVALLVAAMAGFLVGRAKLPVQQAKQPTNLERFWEPITSTSSRVTYCLGEPTESVDLQVRATNDGYESGSLNLYDVVTLARSIVPLVPLNGDFRVLAATDTGFAQLREGPSVLIGAFDNPWTMRVTQDLPFGFEYDSHSRRVVDRKSSPRRFWALRWEIPNSKVAEDYAVVARIHDKVTGQPVIVLAGILGEGTEAASEVVSNPVYLNAVLEKAPADWDQKSLEAIIETTVIDGHPGPPTVIAVQTW